MHVELRVDARHVDWATHRHDPGNRSRKGVRFLFSFSRLRVCLAHVDPRVNARHEELRVNARHEELRVNTRHEELRVYARRVRVNARHVDWATRRHALGNRSRKGVRCLFSFSRL